MIRLLVCGSREITDYDFVYNYIKRLCTGRVIDCIISGMARGVDTYAAEYAQNNGLKLLEFPITKEDWNLHGKKAGYLRNKKQRDEGNPTHVLAFLHKDFPCNGTKSMIKLAQEKNIPVKVVMYNKSKGEEQ